MLSAVVRAPPSGEIADRRLTMEPPQGEGSEGSRNETESGSANRFVEPSKTGSQGRAASASRLAVARNAAESLLVLADCRKFERRRWDRQLRSAPFTDVQPRDVNGGGVRDVLQAYPVPRPAIEAVSTRRECGGSHVS